MEPIVMFAGGPVPAWTPAEYRRAQREYDRIVAFENSASARPKLTLSASVLTSLADAVADYLVHLCRTGLLHDDDLN